VSPEQQKRKLAAILCAGAVETGRLPGEDETRTLPTLKGHHETMSSLIETHRGRVVDSPGGSLLGEFGSAVDAVQCAVGIQNELKARNDAVPEADRILFRIGVHLGEITEGNGTVRGEGVDVAARLEGMADAGGICISGNAYGQVKGKVPAEYESLGAHRVQGIAEPVRAYRVVRNLAESPAGVGWCLIWNSGLLS